MFDKIFRRLCNWQFDHKRDFVGLITYILRWRDVNVQKMIRMQNNFTYKQVKPIHPKLTFEQKPPQRQIGWWTVKTKNNELFHLYWNGIHFEYNIYHHVRYGWLLDHAYEDNIEFLVTNCKPDYRWDREKQESVLAQHNLVWQNDKWIAKIA